MPVRRAPVLPIIALFAAVALAACGGAYASGKKSGVAGAARKGAVVELRTTALGKVLADARGRTLYLYTPDASGKSTCYGGCASAWPPLLTAAKPHAARGLSAKLLGTTRRSDGKLQVTYRGHPLYLYGGDRRPGQTNGEDVGGVWYAVSASGARAERKGAADSTTRPAATTPDSGYGSGY